MKMNLLRELKKLNEEEILTESEALEFIKAAVENLAWLINHDPSGTVAEALAIAVIFAAGGLWNYYSSVYMNARDFVKKLIRINKMKDPEKQYQELKKFSVDIEKMVDEALTNKNIDAKTRRELKSVKTDLQGRLERMGQHIENFKDRGHFPGEPSDVPERVKTQVEKFTGYFNDLKFRVKDALEHQKKPKETKV